MGSGSPLCPACAAAVLLLLTCAGPVRADRFDDDLLVQINEYRTARKLGKLVMKPGLVKVARDHSREMKHYGRLNHDAFQLRFRLARKHGARSCVENVGWNHDTPRQFFEAWKNSPGHNRNMLDPAMTGAGIARSGRYVTFFACEIPIQPTPWRR